MFEYNLPDSLQVERDDRLLLVRLTRPAKRNALNDATILGLEQIFTHIPAEIGAVVLTGEGDHFSAGLDLSELRERDAMEGVGHSHMWQRTMQSIQFGPVPVVTVLQGAVV